MATTTDFWGQFPINTNASNLANGASNPSAQLLQTPNRMTTVAAQQQAPPPAPQAASLGSVGGYQQAGPPAVSQDATPFTPDAATKQRQAATAGTGMVANKDTVLAYVKNWQASHPASPQSFQELANNLQTLYGVTRWDTGAGGPSNNEFNIGGEKVKVLGGEDSSSPSWFAYGSNDGGAAGGGAAGASAGWGPGGLPEGYTLGDITGGGKYPLSSFDAPGINKPWTTAFTAPDNITEQNDPGYKARLDMGINGMQRSAAAKGTLLTGGLQKDLNQFSQDYASNEYDKVYNRALGEYNTAYGIYNTNQNNVVNRLTALGNVGLNASS